MIRQLTAVALSAILIAAATNTTIDTRHLRLERSQPAADSTISESPTKIQLWFNQPPQTAVSRITMSRGDEEIEIGETRGASENSLVAEIQATLVPARYTVNWRTAGNDGHVLRGDFDFTIASTDRR